MNPLETLKNTLFSIDYIPKRIISLVPSQTELLYDLGLEDQIVGVTKFCVHPSRAKKTKSIVGGTKTIHQDRIKALNPDIILCNKEENTKEIVELCTQIAPTHVSDIFNLEDSKNLIRSYGSIFSKRIEANHLIQKIISQENMFQAFIREKPVFKVAYFIWRNPWMVAAKNTFIHHLLTVNRFENIFEDLERYPEVSMASFNSRKEIDFILLSSEPYPFKKEHGLEIKQQLGKGDVIFVDGEMFSWYGSRLEKAFAYFKELRISLEKSVG